MATITSLANLLAAELNRANNKTGNIDTNLHDAITRLINGYGHGEIPEPIPPTPEDIPENYTKMAYLESSGQQYINLNYVPQQNDIIYCTAQYMNSTSSYSYLFGTYNPTCAILSKDNKLYLNFGLSSSVITNVTATNKNNIILSTNSIIVNDVQVAPISGVFEAMSLTNTFLFSAQDQNNRSNPLEKCSARIYSFKVVRSGQEIINLIPVLNPSNVLGMYDTINKVFLANIGTGYFSSEEA